VECVVTEADYAEFGRGLVDADNLASTLDYATQVVGLYIGCNEPDSYDEMRAYTRAVCAVADVDASYGYSRGSMEGMSSIKIGDFSASYTSSTASSAYDSDIAATIRRELAGTGLLYSGVR
jgi:hypothetical protein